MFWVQSKIQERVESMDFDPGAVAKMWSVIERYATKDTWDYHVHIASMRRGDQVWIDRHRRHFLSYMLSRLSARCRPFCVFRDAGTKAPTSDIDVTSFYAQPTAVIHHAQHIAQEVYGPGVTLQRLFDINVYAHTWYISCAPRGVTIYEECPERRKFMTPDVLMQQFLWGTLRICQSRRNALARLIFYALPRNMQAASVNLQRRVRYAAKRPGAIDTAISRVMSLMNQLPQKMYQYFDANSYLASLQHDAYYTVGAYNHVVLHMQRRMTIRMTDAEYLMSLLDNLGFVCSLIRTQNGDAAPGGKMLKYFYRCIDAMINLGFDKPIVLHRILKTFYTAKLRGNSKLYHVHMDKIRSIFKSNRMIVHFLADKVSNVMRGFLQPLPDSPGVAT